MSRSTDIPYIPAIDPYFDFLAPAVRQNDATTEVKKEDMEGQRIMPIKAIPWPRPTDDKGQVSDSPPTNPRPIFPWDYYFCDIAIGLAKVGRILESTDCKGRGLNVAFPEVFDGARYGREPMEKCQKTISSASKKLLHEYTDYGRQEKGEYVRFYEAVTGRKVDMEWLHRTAAEKSRGAGMVNCSVCELRFPGEAEKKMHEKIRHEVGQEKGSVPITPDSWKTPLEPPTVGPSMMLIPSVNDSVNPTNSVSG